MTAVYSTYRCQSNIMHRCRKQYIFNRKWSSKLLSAHRFETAKSTATQQCRKIGSSAHFANIWSFSSGVSLKSHTKLWCLNHCRNVVILSIWSICSNHGTLLCLWWLVSLQLPGNEKVRIRAFGTWLSGECAHQSQSWVILKTAFAFPMEKSTTRAILVCPDAVFGWK